MTNKKTKTMTKTMTKAKARIHNSIHRFYDLDNVDKNSRIGRIKIGLLVGLDRTIYTHYTVFWTGTGSMFVINEPNIKCENI